MSTGPNTPIVATNYQRKTDPYNYCFYGAAHATDGLAVISQINGVGLLTNGLVWQGSEIWSDVHALSGLATGWTAAAGYSGCAAASLIATSWTTSTALGMSEYQLL